MSFSHLKNELEEIRKLALRRCYSDELLDRLQKATIGYATTTISLEFARCFRARIISDDFKFNHVNELWVPPARLLRKFGRANAPYQPMLYVTNGENVAYREVGAKVGDRVAILRMGARKTGGHPNLFSIGEVAHRVDSGTSLMGGSPDGVIPKLRAMGREQFKRSLIIDRFFAKIFRQEGSEYYPLTAAIAQDYLSTELVDGLAYPSVAGEGFNIAMKPDSALRLIAISQVIVTRVIEDRGDDLLVRCEGISESLDHLGNIVWSTRKRAA